MVLVHARHSFHTHWSPLWVFTWRFVLISYLPLNFDKDSCSKINVVHLIGISCVECLVGNNITIQSLNENFNGCLYLVLDWYNVFGIVCGNLFSLSKSSLIFLNETVSYLQFYRSVIFVSQVVDSNIVFNHHYIYLVQLWLFYRW